MGTTNGQRERGVNNEYRHAAERKYDINAGYIQPRRGIKIGWINFEIFIVLLNNI